MSDRGQWTSASNAEADSLCPGRHLLQRGLPEEKSADAEFGTALHDALKRGSDEGLTLEQKDLYESCEKIVEKVVKAFFGSDAKLQVSNEQRLWLHLSQISGRQSGQMGLSHSGQLDRLYVCLEQKKALVVEWKSLAGTVASSPRNLQLRDQAVLASDNLFGDEVIAVGTVVIQPLVTHSPEICEYTKVDLGRAWGELAHRIVASNDPASPRIAGETQCKFCRAKKICPEYGQWAGGQLPVPRSLVDVPMDRWDGQQFATFLAGRAIAQKWLDDAYNLAKTRLKANAEEIPGWGLKDGAIREYVNDPAALLNRLWQNHGKDKLGCWESTVDAFMKCISVKKKEFKQVVHTISGLKGQALDKAVDELLAGLVDEKQNEPSIERKDS